VKESRYDKARKYHYLYDTKWWKDNRKAHLAEYPLCAECQKAGRVTAARVVHHLKPHKGDERVFRDRSQWESLCKSCHDKHTAEEDGGFGNKAGVKKVSSACGADGLPVDGRHHWKG